ncbi:hypothetical protein B566_EDAN009737, partial [Ephemera danica]
MSRPTFLTIYLTEKLACVMSACGMGECESCVGCRSRIDHSRLSLQCFSLEMEKHLETNVDGNAAKQRASIKWLLSKAFNNRVPDNLREPFYRDHEGQYHLKPHIVQTLANAELYCLALGNIYADPNFHNLNHSGVVQALIRKGVNPDPPGTDCPLTETTLIQTSPLRL